MVGNEFTCIDRNGIAIACSRECWSKHVTVHPEILGQQELIKIIITHPLSEYQDVRHVDTRNYYKSVVLPGIGNTLVKVSIQYSKKYGRERGFVKTAYATDNIKKGEIWLWGHKFTN